MNASEFPGGQPFNALEAAERARYEQQLRAIYGVSRRGELEDRVAQGMQEYDANRQRIDEIMGGHRSANENGPDTTSDSTRESWRFDLEEDLAERQPRVTRPTKTRTGWNPGRTSRTFAGLGRENRPTFEFPRQPVTMARPNKKADDSEGYRGWKGAAATVTALAMAGGAILLATSGDDEKASSNTAPWENGPSPTVELASRSLAMYEMSDALLVGDKEDIAQAEKTIPQISAGDTELGGSLHQAVDYAKAYNILTNPNAASGYVFTPDSITDVPLRQRTDTVLYTLNADEVLKTVSGYDAPTPEEARREIGQAPKGAETVEAHANEAIELKQIDSALSAYRTSAMDPEALATVQAVADQISNPELKQKMQSFIQGLTATEVLEDLYLGDIAPTDVVAYAQTVADPQLKADLVRLSGEVDEYGGYNEAHYYASDLSTSLYDSQDQEFGADNTDFAADLSNARNEKSAIGLEASQAAHDAEATFTGTLAEEADLEPEMSAPALAQETNPYEVIDLTKVEVSEEVPNVSEELLEEDGTDHPAQFAQFGEVYIDEGQMKTVYGDELSPEVKDQFNQVLESNDPLLRAAFAGGTLVTVRLVLGDTFDPYYNNATREAVIQVADDNEMTVDQLSSAMTHEIGGHANLRDFFQGIEVSDSEHRALAETCFNLQTLTYKDLEGQLSIRPELMINLRAAAKPEHQAIIDTLAKAVENGNLTSLLTDFTEYETTFSNECDYTGDPSIMMVNAAYGAPSFDLSKFEASDLDYLYEKTAYQEFADAVGLHLEYGSVFSKAINESGYVMTESIDKLYLGHSRDSANELFASLMDAALNYSDQLQANLAELEPEEAQAVLRTLALACNVLETRAPSLAPLLDGTRQKFGITS